MSVNDWAYLAVARVVVAIRDAEQLGQASLFTASQRFVQRVLLVLALCGLILMSLAGLYTLLAIDPRKLIFRHHLIFFLLFFDLIKAIVLLIYPARVLQHHQLYSNTKLCQAAGFFTAFAIEGADIAILAFAVHTYLLIFYPELTVKVRNAVVPRSEGGLYRYRFYVYAFAFFFPVLMSLLAFIHPTGYLPYVCWCYLPQRPVWYRFVLSWVPRYVILVLIIAIYVYIYFHVIREFKKLGGVFNTIHNKGQRKTPGKQLILRTIRYHILRVKDAVLPQMVLPERSSSSSETAQAPSPRKLALKSPQNSSDAPVDTIKEEAEEEPSEDSQATSVLTPVHVDPRDIVYDKDFHQSNLENFRRRQKIIEKQMKLIFIYPFAYFLIWLFPFILQATQVNYEQKHGPILWLNGMGAFMQPIPGFIDTLVFFYREQPWRYTVMKTFENEHRLRMHLMTSATTPSSPEDQNLSAILTKPSLPTDLIDDYNYLWWRRLANQLRLPLFGLPTESRVKAIHNKITPEHIEPPQTKSSSTAGQMLDRLQPVYVPTSAGATMVGHDFSALLQDDPNERDFRQNKLENYSLDFSTHRSSVLSPRKGSVFLGSQRLHNLNQLRRFLLADTSDAKQGSGRRGSVANVAKATTPRQTLGDDMDILEFLRKGP